MDSPFGTSREHLHAELVRVDLLIQREIWRWRQVDAPRSPSEEEFRGLYVSEAEVDAILAGVYPGGDQVARQADGQRTEDAFCQAIERAAAEIRVRKAASLERGIHLGLERLRLLFGLTPFDLDTLLISLAPELELHYERLYAYLQDDMTRRRPSVGMVLNLLCATRDDRLDARKRFSPGAPLMRYRLLELFSDPAQPHPPLLAQCVKPDPRVVEYVVQGSDRWKHGDLDGRLCGFCDLSWLTVELETLSLPSDAKAQLSRLVALGCDTDAGVREETSPVGLGLGAPTIAILVGDRGAAQHEAAQAVCTACGRPLLAVSLARLLGQDSSFGESVRLAAREAYLVGASVFWQDYDVLSGRRAGEPDWSLHRKALHDALLEYPVFSFLQVEDTDRQPDRALLGAPRLVRVVFERPSYALRYGMWDRLIGEYDTAPDVDLRGVAGRFRLVNDQIRDAVLDAHHRAAQRPPSLQAITTGDVFAAARARTSGQLLDLAKKITPRHTWDDIVLPKDQVEQLHEMCDQIKYRPIVLGEWGFDRKLSMGKGLNVLFGGPSGTGKTMAAEVIAGDLGLDLYKVDLSTVVSKYVGETEKNLERIFGAARNSNSILFFDEADALFGKRSEVRDAHDRYANVEISYLLQKMEEYDGLVILTTNLSKNIDEAFSRRMHFTVEFPYPEEDARRRIWRIAFPEGAPLAPDVDFDLLADRYRLTGGNIRNVTLTAAFLAARDGGVIGMDHLLWATRREFQKMGRLVDEREFEMR